MKHRTAPRSPAILGKGAPHADKRKVEEFVRFQYEIKDSILEYEMKKAGYIRPLVDIEHGMEDTNPLSTDEPGVESEADVGRPS